MSVRKMKRITVFGLKKYRKSVMEHLQRCGVIEIRNTDLEDTVFYKQDTSQQSNIFHKTSALAVKASEIIDRNCGTKKSLLSSFEGRKVISAEDYYKFVDEDTEIMRIGYRVLSLDKSISEEKSEISRLQLQLGSLEPWRNLDVSMRFKGTNTTSAFIGILPDEQTKESIINNLTEFFKEKDADVKGFDIEVVSSSKEQTCIFILCLKNDKDNMEMALRKLGFAKPMSPSKATPKERIIELKKRIKTHESNIENYTNEIKEYVGISNALKFMSDYYTMRAEKYEALELLSNSKRTFILTGYVAESDAPELEKSLVNDYHSAVEIEEPDKKEEVPVSLKNNTFTSPVEGVLETYSLPKKNEIDPTNFMAIFYYIFFGLMFSDAGYGIVMFLGCLILLLKFKNMEESLRKNLKMFCFCGISTTIWGFLLGSFFGDAVQVIASTFFGREDISLKPLWFSPIDDPMKMLMFSFLLGIIHLFTGLALNAYQLIKRKKYIDVIYDVLSWYMIVLGAVFALFTTEMFADMVGFEKPLPSIVGTVGGVCAVLGILIVLFTSGRTSKSPVKRLLKGAYGVYGITSWLSDILSYSRLLALGLATGVIAQVFNKIGTMFGGGVVGAILFAIIFIVGHSINIGINALGAYVHTNRLQFVEFFNKFYEGGGVKFNPFKINTKYYKIREDIKNG